MKILALCVIVTFLGVTNARLKRNCPEMCPEVYSPVCGFDGLEEKTFGNECKMLQFNCNRDVSRDFHVVKSGPCATNARLQRNCPEMCSEVYSPVCGFDGLEERTFGNECKMLQFNCNRDVSRDFHAIKSGPCDSNVPKPRVRIGKRDCGKCPQVYDPVCGVEGQESRTFNNKCMIKVHNCQMNRKFVFKTKGTCSDK